MSRVITKFTTRVPHWRPHVTPVDLDHASDEQREALILIGASGFSYEEAAEICGCATGTLKSRVHRARARLRDETVIFGNNALGGTPHIWEIAGTTLDGTLIVDFVSSSNPNTAALKEVYEAEHGENSFVGLHANVWDGLMLIKKAVETAGSTDGTAARDEFQKISDFPASFGQPGFRHHYSEERHNGTSMSAHIILQFKDGLPSVVWDVFQP